MQSGQLKGTNGSCGCGASVLLFLILFLVFFFALQWFVGSCNSTRPVAPIETSNTNTPEHNLAIIQSHNGDLPASDPLVAKFGRLLDRLQSRSKQSRGEIADIITNTQTLFKEKKGIELSVLEIAMGLDKSTAQLGKSKVDLAEIAAVLLALTTKK